MNETLYLAYPSRLDAKAKLVATKLEAKGFVVEEANEKRLEGSLVLLLLDMATTVDEIYASAPWLEKQFEYSSLKALRLMPFLLYRSSLGEVDDQVKNNPVGETFESLLSGEFKPYGFDEDADDPLIEFDRVLETYSE